MTKRKLFALALFIIPLIGFILHNVIENRPIDLRIFFERFWSLLLGFASGSGLVLLFIFISQERALKCILETNIIDTREADKQVNSIRKQLDRIYKKYIKHEKSNSNRKTESSL